MLGLTFASPLLQDRDTLTDLRSSVHYYENVAEDDGDETRKATLQEMSKKLRKVLTRVENELQSRAHLYSAMHDPDHLQLLTPRSRSSKTTRRISSTSPSCNSIG